MDKIYVKHYILATYGNTSALNYREHAMIELVNWYNVVSARIKAALVHNGIEDPDSIVSYSFRMLGEHHDDMFNRREMVSVDIQALRADPMSFPWGDYGWVQAFQPIIDVAGYTIVEIDSEYQSFGSEPPVDGDYVQPCFRIYEKGRPEYVKGGFTSQRDQPSREEPHGFYEDVVSPVGRVIKANALSLIAIGSAFATFAVLWRTTNHLAEDLDRHTADMSEVLHHLEDLVEDAIEMPQIVKVEFPDDSEVIGYGRKTW